MNTDSTSRVAKASTGRRRVVLKAITEHWLPFLTALLVLATAAVGLYAKQTATERDELQDNSASFETQVTQLSNRNDELLAANEQLQTDNDDLREQIESLEQTAPPATATPPTTSDPSSSTSEVFRETSGTPVVVAEYSGIDLDSQDPNWGIETSSRDMYVGGGARDVNVSDTLTIVGTSPTAEDCEAQTVRQGRLDAAQTVVGQQMCVRSRDGRWAYVRIAAIDTEAATISFDIVVWKLPSDPE